MDKKVVIIPTYNEKENIEAIILKTLSLSDNFDILIVDDGSPDGTAAIVHSIIAQNPERVHIIERSGKLGLGTAYITGFKWALDSGYEYIFEMDADFSHNPEDLHHLYIACRDKNALTVGSRYVTGVNVVNWPIGRVIMSYYASVFVRRVTGMKVKDATAGFVGYRAELLRAIDFDAIKMKGYGFQIEMKYTAWRLGFTLGEVSIIFTDRTKGSSKMSSGIFGEAFWGVLRLPLRRIKRKKNEDTN